MESSTSKIFSGISWSIIYNFINAIYGFISIPLLINYYGKGHYGLIGIALSVNVYVQLMDMGLNSTNIRFFSSWIASGEKEKVKNGFQTSLTFYGVVGLLNSIILFIVSAFTGQIFSISEEDVVILRHLFLILAFSSIISWYSSSFDQLIRATENVAWIQKRSILTKIAQFISLILAILFKLGIEIYFALSILSLFIIVPLSVSKIKKELPFVSFNLKWNSRIVKDILPYCLNVFSFSIFQFSFWNLRPVLLGICSSAEAVADFRIMNGIAGIVVALSSTFLGVLLPSVSKVAALGNMKAYYKVAYDGTKYITVFLSLLCFGLITIIPDILILYVGKDFLYLTPWMTIWTLCLLGYSNQAISSIVLAGDKLRPLAINSALASLMGLLAVWLTIPYYNVGAAVVGHVVYTIIQQVFYYCIYWPRTFHINTKQLFIKNVLPAILLGGIICVVTNVVFLSLDRGLCRLLISGFLFFVFYCMGAAFLFNEKDRCFIMSIVRKANSK